MFFLLVIWDFIFILGLFYTFLTFWIAFIGIQLLEDVMVPKRTKFFGVPLGLVLRPLSLDLLHQLDVFGHDGHPLSVHSTKVSASRRPTRYASEASCNTIIAPLWNLMFTLPRS